MTQSQLTSSYGEFLILIIPMLFIVAAVWFVGYHDQNIIDEIDIINTIHSIEVTEHGDFLIYANDKVYISTNRHINQVFLDYNNVNVTFEVKYKPKDKTWIKLKYPLIVSIKEV